MFYQLAAILSGNKSMDALSALLEDVSLYDTKYYQLNGHGHWSYSVSKKDSIAFYLVLSGSFCI